MMLKDWLVFLLLTTIALCMLVILVDHIRTELQWRRWYKDQERRKK